MLEKGDFAKILKHSIMLTTILAISACGKDDPIKLPAEHNNLYGVWEKAVSSDNGLSVDNALFVFHEDDTVTYIRCFKKPGKSFSQSLPNFDITKFEKSNLQIQIGWGPFSWTENFVIDKFPYTDQNEMYIEIDEHRLRKLKSSETSSYQSWPCSQDKDKDD